MSFSNLLTFLSSFVSSTSELEKLRMEKHQLEIRRRYHMEKIIMLVIISCKTSDHVKSCRYWIEYLFKDVTFRNRVISLDMLVGLHKAIDLKEEEVRHLGTETTILPHQSRRAERIANAEMYKPHSTSADTFLVACD